MSLVSTFQSAVRASAFAVVHSTVAGCKNGIDTGGPGETFTASIALGASTATIARNQQITLAITLTRGAGFTGDVILGAQDLPTGVTIQEGLIAAGATTGSIRFIASGTAPAIASKAVTIAARGTNVTIGTKSYALTVVP